MFIKNGENDIQLDKSMIIEKIPILVRNENWVKLFGRVKDRDIQKCKEELEDLLRDQAKIEREISHWHKEKVKCMKMILGISDAVNNEERVESVGLLDKYKEKIYYINETIDELTFKLEIMPQKMKDLNYELLNATVKYGYKELKDREKKLADVSDELEDIRERLRDLVNEKHDHEEWISNTYTFLHKMLGSEEMEKLDKEMLE